jgi:hypothetical protein
MKIVKIILVLIIGAFAGFFCACYWNYGTTSYAIKTVLDAKKVYLYDRFVKSYENAPTIVAIWEGTNLVSVLDAESTVRMSPEQREEMLALHARLYALFIESGSKKDAATEAEIARQWFVAIAPNQSVISPEAVVKGFLIRDPVKRKIANL